MTNNQENRQVSEVSQPRITYTIFVYMLIKKANSLRKQMSTS